MLDRGHDVSLVEELLGRVGAGVLVQDLYRDWNLDVFSLGYPDSLVNVAESTIT